MQRRRCYYRTRALTTLAAQPHGAHSERPSYHALRRMQNHIASRYNSQLDVSRRFPATAIYMHPVHRFARHRPRLTIATITGLVVGFALPPQWQALTRALAGWNVAVWSYLLAIGWLMVRASHARVRTIAEQEDKSATAVLAILTVAAMISLAAIVLELTAVKELPLGNRLEHYAFTAATVFGSWLLVGTLFTFHYAHMFYRVPGERQPLVFLGNELDPDYWDFLYFAFTIAVAAQTSDVVIKTRSMRKVVLAQSVLSFLFNVAILGFSINIAAGLIGG